MTQIIIVLAIIVFAILYTIYAVVKSIRKKNSSACGDCNGCGVKDQINRNKSAKPDKDPGSCGCAPQ